jgi:hypothetical protein
LFTGIGLVVSRVGNRESGVGSRESGVGSRKNSATYGLRLTTPEYNQRPVFRISKDTTLLHLGHPLFHQALAMFARARFPGEVKKAMSDNTIQKLAKERDNLLLAMQQLTLFLEDEKEQEEKLRNLEDELKRRQGHYENLLKFLENEQNRVINKVLVNRYQLRGKAQIFPVTVEIRLPLKE